MATTIRPVISLFCILFSKFDEFIYTVEMFDFRLLLDSIAAAIFSCLDNVTTA